jgi:hypothetical protein
MKVYVLFECERHECEFLGVFSTQERADAAWEKWEAGNLYSGVKIVREHDIDDESPLT